MLLHINEDPSGGVSAAEKEEVDSRSIYVGNVRLVPPLIFTCFSYMFVSFLKKVCVFYCFGINEIWRLLVVYFFISSNC
jgi:hypothetical protein